MRAFLYKIIHTFECGDFEEEASLEETLPSVGSWLRGTPLVFHFSTLSHIASA